jgi:CsoR family transcriptional regulator, copper-sensing transcriptional repressor
MPLFPLPDSPDEAALAVPASDPQATVREVSMLDEAQQQNVVTRLNRIEGQVRGIRRMVQEPRLCVEILQQLAAAEAALGRVSLSIFKFHVEKCVPEGIAKGDGEQDKRLSELIDIFDRFAR